MTNELKTILQSIKTIENKMGVLWIEDNAAQLNDIEESAKILDERLSRINDLCTEYLAISKSDELLKSANERLGLS